MLDAGFRMLDKKKIFGNFIKEIERSDFVAVAWLSA
jgi:hypothetical protein